MASSSRALRVREGRLWRAGRAVALCALVVLGALPLLAQAPQENAGSEPAPARAGRPEAPPPRETDLTFSISKVNGQPGKEVNVPVMFSRKEGAANLAKLRVRLQYPGNRLTFVRMEDAYMSRRVKMVQQSKEAPNSQGQSSLELNFDLPETEPRPEYPSGQIATLFFNIAGGNRTHRRRSLDRRPTRAARLAYRQSGTRPGQRHHRTGLFNLFLLHALRLLKIPRLEEEASKNNYADCRRRPTPKGG